jgi:DNA-binding phage protein
MRWVEIFKAGDHVARNGMQREYSAAELEQVAASYDPAVYRAPLIVEHRTNGVEDGEIHKMPWCFGVPSALKVVGDTVKAGFAKVAPEFLEWVENGNLIDVSSGLYAPDDFRNPTPGQWSLRHIAALGSQPPSVKGLKGLEELLYAEDEQPIEIAMPAAKDAFAEFAEPSTDSFIKELVAAAVAPFADRIEVLTKQVEAVPATVELTQETEFMEWDDIVTWAIRQGVTSSGKSPADIAAAADITPERLDVILGKTGEATYDEMQKIVQALGIEMEYSEPSPRELALRQKEADVAKREAELAKQQVTEFMEPLVNDPSGPRVLPGDRAALETVLLHLESSQPLEFAEGDGTVSKSPAGVLRDWMSRLKPQVNFGEVVPGDDEDLGTPEFAEPPGGYTVNRDKQKQLAAAKQYAVKHGSSMDVALKAVGVK